MGTKGRVGSFASDEARRRFLAAYERAMSSWPTPREERDVETRYGTTRIYAHGTGDGTPIVLLHGQNATPAVWASNVTALAAGRCVLAVDRVGEPGRSTQTAPIRTAEDTARWFDEVLSGLGVERVHLVGFSYGGWVALNHAVHTPGKVASVTLVEPAGALARFRPTFLLGVIAAVASGSHSYQRRWFGRPVGGTGEGAEATEAMTRVSLEALRSFRGRLPAPRLLTDEELPSVKAPVMVLLGDASRATEASRAQARAQGLLADVRTEIVPGVGHAMPVKVLNDRVPAFLCDVEARISGGASQ
ncbi:alpha/beta fold hydrolase [Streptomyces sp. NBC_01235]|uniref:alpha/beta fold hydrolase n=1 Tax=Streptomyces sp. NBC_01235 TaxID=2903788 RepID=UPI002E1366B5|nr:alpha/beta fold hydrolase [Streptomyces sp. NBC_01235]